MLGASRSAQRLRPRLRTLPSARGHAGLGIGIDPVLVVTGLPENDVIWTFEHLALTAADTGRSKRSTRRHCQCKRANWREPNEPH